MALWWFAESSYRAQRSHQRCLIMGMTGLVFVIDEESDPDGQSPTMRSIEGVKAWEAQLS